MTREQDVPKYKYTELSIHASLHMLLVRPAILELATFGFEGRALRHNMAWAQDLQQVFRPKTRVTSG